jgi:hypothetical protein
MAVAGLWALAACQPAPLADSAADPMRGVGFGDYESYLAERQAREAQLAGGPALAPEASGAPAASAAGVPGLTAADLAAAGIGVSESVARAPEPAAARPAAFGEATGQGSAPRAAPGLLEAGVAPVIARAEPVASAPPAQGTVPRDQAEGPQISAAATAAAASRSAPVRDVDTGADIVAFALNTTHQVGEQRYRRALASESRAERQCRRYPGADLAQRAFLEAGGPQRDRLGLDPDGDGFACDWTPAPFRAARG